MIFWVGQYRRWRDTLVGWTIKLHTLFGPLWWYAGILFVASRIGDIFNFYTGTIFLPRALSVNELGAVEPVTRLAAFGAIPLAIVSTVGAKYLSAYCAVGAYGKIKRFLRDMTILSLVSSGLFILFLIFTFDAVRVRLSLQSPHLFVGLCLIGVLACWQSIMGVILQGLQRFYTSSAVAFVDPVLRLLLAVLLVPLFGLSGYLFALFVAGLGSITVGASSLRGFIGRTIPSEDYYEEWREILAFALPVAIFIVAGSIQGFIEPFVVKHFLPAQDAAGYYMVCRFGYIPGYLAGTAGYVLFPLLSHHHERGEETSAYLRQAVVVTVSVSAAGTIILGSIAGWLFGLLPAWHPFQAYAPQVWKIGLLATLSAVASIYAMHEIACRRFSFLWAVVPVVMIESIVLYASFGWGAFRSFLPPHVWAWMDQVLPNTLTYALWIMLTARAATALLLAIHWRRLSGARVVARLRT